MPERCSIWCPNVLCEGQCAFKLLMQKLSHVCDLAGNYCGQLVDALYSLLAGGTWLKGARLALKMSSHSLDAIHDGLVPPMANEVLIRVPGVASAVASFDSSVTGYRQGGAAHDQTKMIVHSMKD